MRGTLLLTSALVAIGLATMARGDDWPQFRGPNGSATSAEKHLPATWDADKNVAWKAKLPGYAWSSPIVWGDKVFVTTAVTDKQRKPAGGFGAGGFGPGGAGGPPQAGGFGGFPQPGQVLPSFLQERLKLTAEQKKALEQFQKEVDGKLDKVLTDEQKKQLKERPRGFGPGGFAGRLRPGQVLPPARQDELKLTAEQKKQVEELQKEVDARLDKLLTAEQKKQLQEMPLGFGGGRPGGFGPGGFGPGGFGNQKPPDAVYQFEVLCLDRATGQTLWRQTAAARKPAIPSWSSVYAAETPVTDGARVYAYFGMHGLFCYDLDGQLVWKKDLGAHPMNAGFGTGSSPVLADGRLFVQCDNEEKSFLAALETKTGQELWRVDREEKSTWCTPLIWRNQVRTELVAAGGNKVRSYDPTTGKVLWELAGVGDRRPGNTCSATPVADAERLYVGANEGFGNGPLFAVKAGASGDITPQEGEKASSGVAWVRPRAAPGMASPLVYQGYLYIVEQNLSMLACYDARTGRQVYKERLGGRGFTSSPWAYEGKVFCLDDAGTTHVVQAGKEFKLLSQNKLDEMCWSSPAVAGGALFLRTVEHLYCIKQASGAK